MLRFRYKHAKRIYHLRCWRKRRAFGCRRLIGNNPRSHDNLKCHAYHEHDVSTWGLRRHTAQSLQRKAQQNKQPIFSARAAGCLNKHAIANDRLVERPRPSVEEGETPTQPLTSCALKFISRVQFRTNQTFFCFILEGQTVGDFHVMLTEERVAKHNCALFYRHKRCPWWRIRV